MLKLYLLRHAKSSWNEPALKDFDRPLAPRGWNTAPLIGNYMTDKGYHPTCALCSPARRTRETLEIIEPLLPGNIEVFMNDSLYHAEPSGLLELIRAIPPKCRELLTVGHNPATQELAVLLTGEGDRRLWQSLWSHFPTAGLAVLEFDVASWEELTPRSGRLADFITPKALKKSAG